MKQLLQNFIDRVNRDRLPVEGILWANREDILFEHRFTPDVPRVIYSHSKSFTATAAGMLMDEGKLHLHDTIADQFPEHIPEHMDPVWRKVTLEHALTMSTGANRALLMMAERGQGIGAPDFMKFVLSHPIEHEPGSVFCYSNGDTYMVGRMAEKAAGMTVKEYLKEKLFRPLGMDIDPVWEHCPMGHTFGASGLELRLSHMCRLGMLYLNRGMWQGNRLLSEEWIDNARKVHISSNPNPKPLDWNNGYGFQCWKMPFGESYRFDGAYGQFSCICPEKDVVISVQSTENDCTSLIIQALHEEIFVPLYS